MNEIKLNKLANNSLNNKKMNAIRGGQAYCGCGCHGPSGTKANAEANRAAGLEGGKYVCSPQGNVVVWCEDDGKGMWSDINDKPVIL